MRWRLDERTCVDHLGESAAGTTTAVPASLLSLSLAAIQEEACRDWVEVAVAVASGDTGWRLRNSREPRVLPAAGVGPRKVARQEDPWKETQSRVGAHRGHGEGASRAPSSSSPELCHREQAPNFSESWCPREGLAITALPPSCPGVREASAPCKLSAGRTHSPPTRGHPKL